MATARETAQRHANDVVAGNMGPVMADIMPDVLADMQAKRVGPPRGTNKAQIVDQQTEGDQERFDIKYSNDTDSVTIRSWWEEKDGAWKIVKADRAG